METKDKSQVSAMKAWLLLQRSQILKESQGNFVTGCQSFWQMDEIKKFPDKYIGQSLHEMKRKI